MIFKKFYLLLYYTFYLDIFLTALKSTNPLGQVSDCPSLMQCLPYIINPCGHLGAFDALCSIAKAAITNAITGPKNHATRFFLLLLLPKLIGQNYEIVHASQFSNQL